MSNHEPWSSPLPLPSPSLELSPWSLSPSTLPLRMASALGLVAAVTVGAQLLGPLVSEDNDMLAHLGVLVVASLYLGRAPAWLACGVTLLSLSFGQGHSGFAVTSNGLQFILSFGVFIFTVHQVSRLADQVRYEAWRSKQRAQLLGLFQEFSQSCSQETSREGVTRLLEEFSAQHPSLRNEAAEPEQQLWDSVRAELQRSAERALARIERTEVGEKAAVLEATQALQSTLINSLSHDLQTPLASVLGSFEMLKDPDLRLEPATRQQLADIGYSQTNRLLSLVRNVINLAKLEGGGIRLELSPVELSSVIEAARQRFDPRLARRVQVEGPPERLPCLAWGDRTLLTQIVFNLLDNALKFSPGEKAVTVRLEPGPESLSLSVQDAGCGIESEDLERIFDRFYRGATPTQIPGSGLGLHLCQGLVQLHGGRIAVSSTVGHGATFTLTLPRHREMEHLS